MNLENNTILLKKTKQLFLEKFGYEQLTSIQEKTFPLILTGRDIIAQSGTGTGKTVAFLFPILEKLNQTTQSSFEPRVLIITPTRELALQISKEGEKISPFWKRATNFKTVVACGGMDYNRQLRSFQRGVDIIVGTPGRIIHHLEKKSFSTRKLEFLVVDEVDEMIKEGFLSDVEWIIGKIPPQRQTLLFSATISPKEIEKFSQQFLKNPQLVIGEKEKDWTSNVQHYYIKFPFRISFLTKTQILINLLLHLNKQNRNLEHPKTLVFTNTIKGVERINQWLEPLRKRKIMTDYIHGSLSQNRRTRLLEKFRTGKISVLVATDVLGRGIHVDDIDYVINFDFPRDFTLYKHRIGRTGRAGASGETITFLNSEVEKSQLNPIQPYPLQFNELNRENKIQKAD